MLFRWRRTELLILGMSGSAVTGSVCCVVFALPVGKVLIVFANCTLCVLFGFFIVSCCAFSSSGAWRAYSVDQVVVCSAVAFVGSVVFCVAALYHTSAYGGRRK